MKFEQLKSEYAQLCATMVVRSKWAPAVEATAQKILANKERYQAVSEMTKVPWAFIGIVHQMEAGGSFGCHLHNGDPLAKPTVNVPARRPSGTGPFKWEVSACDALLMKKLDAVPKWSLERVAYELERYNGFGYRNYHKAVLTPYLWSGTNHYARGKYVRDGKWDPNAVSGQTGAMPLLKRLMELDTSIVFALEEIIEAEPPKPAETTPDDFRKANEKRVPLWQKIGAALGLGLTGGSQVPNPVDMAEAGIGYSDRIGKIAMWAMDHWVYAAAIGGWLVAANYWPAIKSKVSS